MYKEEQQKKFNGHTKGIYSTEFQKSLRHNHC